MSELESMVKALALARKDRDNARAFFDGLVREFEQSLAFVDAKKALKLAEETEAIFDTALRGAAEASYEMDGNKKPVKGVEIKLGDKVEIYDEIAARLWCFAHLPDALEPNLKKVEKYAKEFSLPDGVELKRDVPKVYISKNLEVE